MTLNERKSRFGRGEKAAANEARFRARYFAWKARKGFAPVGNDPLTGVAPGLMNSLARAEGRAINILRAKFWFDQARALTAASEARAIRRAS